MRLGILALVSRASVPVQSFRLASSSATQQQLVNQLLSTLFFKHSFCGFIPLNTLHGWRSRHRPLHSFTTMVKCPVKKAGGRKRWELLLFFSKCDYYIFCPGKEGLPRQHKKPCRSHGGKKDLAAPCSGDKVEDVDSERHATKHNIWTLIQLFMKLLCFTVEILLLNFMFYRGNFFDKNRLELFKGNYFNWKYNTMVEIIIKL